MTASPPLPKSAATTQGLPGVRPELTLPPVTQRSAVTNGTRMFVEGDAMSPWARRWRDLVALHVADMGGADALSEAQISLIKRVATIELELEQMDGKLSMGEKVDLDAYSRASGHLRRILDSLGIKRTTKTITPDLATYMAAKREAAR